MAEFKYKIVKDIGLLSANGKYRKEVNLISYNDAEPVYDVRNWTVEEDGSRKMGKGVTLKKDEMKQLVDLLALNIK